MDKSLRHPPIESQPRYESDPHRGPSSYTIYQPVDPVRVKADVMRVASNGSLMSRCLLVLTVDGNSKNFETITGQDGLTFGITDFASDGGIIEFMRLAN